MTTRSDVRPEQYPVELQTKFWTVTDSTLASTVRTELEGDNTVPESIVIGVVEVPVSTNKSKVAYTVGCSSLVSALPVRPLLLRLLRPKVAYVYSSVPSNALEEGSQLANMAVIASVLSARRLTVSSETVAVPLVDCPVMMMDDSVEVESKYCEQPVPAKGCILV